MSESKKLPGYGGIRRETAVNGQAENEKVVIRPAEESEQRTLFEEEITAEADLKDFADGMFPANANDGFTAEERSERQRAFIAQRKAEIEKIHAELSKRLDEAISAEAVRASNVYGIENSKKNTMDYALQVYGEDADLESISRSADKAVEQASEDVYGRSGVLERLTGKNGSTVTVATTVGVRTMDAMVAEALSAFTVKKSGSDYRSLAARLNDGDSELNDLYTEGFEFDREEEEKLARLKDMIEKDDREAEKFAEKNPGSMTKYEYDSFEKNRNGRAVTDEWDYVRLPDGTYRPLPLLSPEMKERLREEQYGISYGYRDSEYSR